LDGRVAVPAELARVVVVPTRYGSFIEKCAFLIFFLLFV
jgi:hypothetical protein